MLHEDTMFDPDNEPAVDQWRDAVIRRCTFDGLEFEGVTFDGLIEGCSFLSSELYWVLFNVAIVANTRFEACRFRSASFRGTTFVDCEFVECTFDLDNLGSDCTIDDCLMAACRFTRCTWLTKAGDTTRDITRTRWLGCSATDCDGFDGIW